MKDVLKNDSCAIFVYYREEKIKFSSEQTHGLDYFICSGWHVTRTNLGISLGGGKSLGKNNTIFNDNSPSGLFSAMLQIIKLTSKLDITELRIPAGQR